MARKKFSRKWIVIEILDCFPGRYINGCPENLDSPEEFEHLVVLHGEKKQQSSLIVGWALFHKTAK